MHNLHSYYNLDTHIVLEHLNSRLSGINSREVFQKQSENGKNIFEEGRKLNLLKTFLSQFLSPLIFILIFACALTFYLNEIVETIVISLAILINVCFSTYQEYKAENTIEQLKKFIKNKTVVKRWGELMEIDAEELTLGDIVILQYGARVPADIRLLETNNLQIDESILTGESLPVNKENAIVTSHLITERINYAFCGTLVNNGNGVGVVTHIGEQTEIGKIAKSLTDTKKTLTPVQTAINKISWYIFCIAIVIVTFVFVLGIYRGENIFDMLILSSAVAVGAVPEALPIALTVILSIGVLNISKKGGLIRKLAAAETLGSTTLILTDKTGTLTEGKLNIENIYSVEEILNTNNNQNVFDLNNISNFQKEILFKASQNINSDFSGNSFDNIITATLKELKIENRNKRNIILPFNSSNKYSISANENIINILGAPDILIKNSNLNDEVKEKLLSQIHILSESGKRLVAIAEKIIQNNAGNKNIEDLNILGIFVFSDTLRKNIKQAILDIENKGVKVKIISGDLPGTVKYIAEKVGLNIKDEEILTGAQIEDLTDSDLLEILPKVKIFARVTPEDKLRIGKLYQSLGEVVAMTGDGVNDSPALKAMDLGISLSSGSEVAKSASDMILLKNNFKTITDTINEGHNIKANIQKVFIYLMSNSLDEVFVVTGSLIAGLALPLTALQIIWVNILTGTLPALAFAYDKNHNVSKVAKDIFDFKVKFLSLGIGTLSSLLLFALYYLLSVNIKDIQIAQSIFFLCFALYILIIVFSFKSLDKYIWQYNPFNNWRLNVGVSVGTALVFLTVYTPLGREVFELTYVPISYLWILFAWLILNLWIVEISKFVYRKIDGK